MKKKLIALVLMLTLALTFGLVACGGDEEPAPATVTTYAAFYGHNGLTFADVTVDTEGTIVNLVLDEIEWNFFNWNNWPEAQRTAIPAAGHTKAIVTGAGTSGEATNHVAKFIELNGIKFTLDDGGNFYVSNENVQFDRNAEAGKDYLGRKLYGVYKVGGSEKASLPSGAGNANAYDWELENTLHVTNSIRSGEFYVLKADGSRYAFDFYRPYGSSATTEKNEELANIGSGHYFNATKLEKNQLFVKSCFYPRRNVSGGREDSGLVAGTQLSYDANMAAIRYWILGTCEGKLPTNWYNESQTNNQPKKEGSPFAEDLTAITTGISRQTGNSTGLNSMFFYGGVAIGATFNDTNWYLFTVYTAYHLNPNAK